MIKIEYLKEKEKEKISDILNPIVKEWFFSRYRDFSPTQRYGVLNIWERKNILISAPTGGTKTLTAFLSILNYLVNLSEKQELENKVYSIYVSPLKALGNDIHKNLIEPLEEIKEIAERRGIKLQEIRIGLKTGDTSVSERAKMSKKAPHILITTPESLAIAISSKKFVEYFRFLEFFILDEIHSLDNKRGVHLSLTIERLNEISSIWPVKIGLSATVAPLELVAEYLVGNGGDEERTVGIAEINFNKKLDIGVLTPVKNLIEDKEIYEDMYKLLNNLIKEHKTTLIFTNTRSATERVVNKLKENYPVEYGDNIAAHHSSLSKSHRFNIEERLRNGELKVVVCSTSLELGIDIGFIDLVIMLGSPKSSSRALQRIGRSGHKLHETAKGRFIVMDRDDLLECCVIQKEMIEKKINKIQFSKNCLDVLAQQIYGMAIHRIWNIDEMYGLIKKSYCYSNLSKQDFLSVISYLSGEYGLEENSVYKKIWYDLETKEIGKKGKMARVIYLTNIGTIPDESQINVKLAPSGEKIGFIDEGFLERMKKGDIFVLGGNKYIYLYSRGMNIYVKPAVNRSPTIPSWFSETLPLSFDSALEINRFRSLLKQKIENKEEKEEIIEFIKKYIYVDKYVAESVYSYFLEQNKFAEIPSSSQLLVEHYKAEKNYFVFHSMYGRRVNDALSRAIAYVVGDENKRDIEIGINDRGFYLAGEKIEIEKVFKKLNEDNLEKILKEAINKTDVLTRRFRHCASRSLMILRNYKGKSKSVGKQQLKSHFLMAAVKKISNDFPILKEAKREVLEDLMDLENAKLVMNWIDKKKVKIKVFETQLPSPFALNLILQGYSDIIRIEDKQEFLKRMHELHLKVIESKQNKNEN